MAPPSASLPLKQRLIKLAQTLQFAWFVGHLTLLLSILRYGLSYITFNYYSRLASFSYRTAFLSAAATYGIVVYKAFRARARATGKPVTSPLALAADENVQYLSLALVWLWSRQYPLAMLPFGVYSIFHIATYTRTNLVPTLQAGASSTGTSSASSTNQSSAISDTIGRFVKEYYDASMGLVAILEIALWGRIFVSAISFASGSWVLIAIYTAFLRARYAQSSFVQGQFRQLEARIDSLVGAQSTPPTVRQAWGTLKSSLRIFHDATDVSKYVGGVPVQKKAT
ncbi:Nucleoporin [Podosphaera aphanis]|nr:Nucleoporin [Podosphaera aphanis]